MRLRQKKIDPLSQVMAAVDAAQHEDEPRLLASMEALSSLSPADIIGQLGNFFQRIHGSIKPEQKQVMIEELNATDNSPDIKVAVLEIGAALFVNIDARATGEAMALHVSKAQDASAFVTNIIGELILATARICTRLDVKLKFS